MLTQFYVDLMFLYLFPYPAPLLPVYYWFAIRHKVFCRPVCQPVPEHTQDKAVLSVYAELTGRLDSFQGFDKS